MPIKFRCSHCNQFLGISRARSGGIVDCPSCGRSIRVPNLDGTVAPLPKPAIDLSDTGLASALEQLASLEAGVAGSGPASASATQITPARVAPPPPVIAVAVDPPVTSPSDVPGVSEPGRAGLPWIEVEEQLSALAREQPGTSATTTLRGPGVTRRDMIVAASTAAAVGPFVWWLTRSSRPSTSSANVPHVASEQPQPSPAPQAEPIAASTPALTGRITYVTADGESRPDAGARVLIFPERRQGTTLLSVDGFRANALAADLQLARESMKLYGGAYVIADEHGRYEANLTSSGMYEVLIISNYQSRPAGPLPPDLLQALGRYFERPQQLIGQTAYEYTHLRFTGRDLAVRDQVFQRI